MKIGAASTTPDASRMCHQPSDYSCWLSLVSLSTSCFLLLFPCTGYLVHPIKKRHIEKRLIKEKRETNVELAREGLLDEGCCAGAREPSRPCLQGSRE